MRAILAAFILFSGLATAQAGPVEVMPETKIAVGVGQTRVFRFEDAFARVDVLTKGTIEATAQTDHQLAIVGASPGETQLYVFSSDGKRMFDALITVTPEAGHQVKIYGTGKNDDVNAGHVSIYCTDTGCGRPDKDLPTPNVSVERVSRGQKDVRY